MFVCVYQVESLYCRVSLDSGKMTQLMILGFQEREARLGLRACQGNVEEAAIYISNQRQVTRTCTHLHQQVRLRSEREMSCFCVLFALIRSKLSRGREKEGKEADDWRSSPSLLSWDTQGEKQPELRTLLMGTWTKPMESVRHNQIIKNILQPALFAQLHWRGIPVEGISWFFFLLCLRVCLDPFGLGSTCSVQQ